MVPKPTSKLSTPPSYLWVNIEGDPDKIAKKDIPKVRNHVMAHFLAQHEGEDPGRRHSTLDSTEEPVKSDAVSSPKHSSTRFSRISRPLVKPDPKRGQDLVLLRSGSASCPIYFPAHSMSSGELSIGDIRAQAAITMDSVARRIKLLYEGRFLEDDSRSCRAEGLIEGAEIKCLDGVAWANFLNAFSNLISRPLAVVSDGKSTKGGRSFNMDGKSKGLAGLLRSGFVTGFRHPPPGHGNPRLGVLQIGSIRQSPNTPSSSLLQVINANWNMLSQAERERIVALTSNAPPADHPEPIEVVIISKHALVSPSRSIVSLWVHPSSLDKIRDSLLEKFAVRIRTSEPEGDASMCRQTTVTQLIHPFPYLHFLDYIAERFLKAMALRYFLERALERMSLAAFRNEVTRMLEDYAQTVSRNDAAIWERNLARLIQMDSRYLATCIRRSLHTSLWRHYEFVFMQSCFELWRGGSLYEFHVNELYPLGSEIDKAYDKYVRRKWTGMDKILHSSSAFTTLQIRLSGLAFCSNLLALPPGPDPDVSNSMTKSEGRIRRLLDFIISSKAFWAIKRVLQRCVDDDHQEISWTCGCGKAMRAVVKEVSAGIANNVQEEIRLCAASSGQNPNAPAQAHTPSSSSRPGENPQPLETMPPLNTYLPTSSIGGQTASAFVPNAQGLQCNPPNRSFVLLCVDTNRLQYLEHIDVTSLQNDEHMFKLIREAYTRVRGQYDWKVSMLLPKWLPSWEWVDTMSLLVPKSADYIKFQIVPVKKSLSPSLLNKPELPPESEVKSRHYDYIPCPPGLQDPMLAVQFIHELLTPGEHLDNYWLLTFPKKLESELQYVSGQPAPIGWGIYITEGLNWTMLAGWTLFVLLFISVGVVLYGVLTKDVSSGLALGQLLIAIVALGVGQSWAKWQNA